MPIVIPRNGPVSASDIPRQYRDSQFRAKLWEALIRNCVEAHPEIFDLLRQDDKEKVQ